MDLAAQNDYMPLEIMTDCAKRSYLTNPPPRLSVEVSRPGPGDHLGARGVWGLPARLREETPGDDRWPEP